MKKRDTEKIYRKILAITAAGNMALSGVLADASLLTVHAEESSNNKSSLMALFDNALEKGKSLTSSLVNFFHNDSSESHEIYRFSMSSYQTINLSDILVGSGSVRAEDVDDYLETIKDISVSDETVLQTVTDENGNILITALTPFETAQSILITDIHERKIVVTVTNNEYEPVYTVITTDEYGIEHTGSVSARNTSGALFQEGTTIYGDAEYKEDAVEAVKIYDPAIYADYQVFGIYVSEISQEGYRFSYALPKPAAGKEYRLFQVSEEGVTELEGEIITTVISGEELAAEVSFDASVSGTFVLACLKDFKYSIENDEYLYSLYSGTEFKLSDVLKATGISSAEYTPLFINEMHSVATDHNEKLKIEQTDHDVVIHAEEFFDESTLRITMNDGQTAAILIRDLRDDITKTYANTLQVVKPQYEVAVSYNPSANIPDESELSVKEIPYYTNQGKELSSQAAELLKVDKNDVVDVTLIDLSICDVEGYNVQPETPVDVKIQVTSSLSEKYETQIAAIGGDNPVLTANETETGVSHETTASSMEPVYALVTVSLTKTLRASDGNNYEITATYDRKTAGIPDGSELVVEEIGYDNENYARYLEETASVVAADATDINARFFDISFVYEGEEIEPAATVNVTIELANEAAVESAQVIHFGNESTELLDAIVDNKSEGNTYSFETGSFSVYGIVTISSIDIKQDVPYYLSSFNGGIRYVKNTLVTEDPAGFGKTNNLNEAGQFYFKKSNEDNTYYMYTKTDAGDQYVFFEKYSDNEGRIKLTSEPTAAMKLTAANNNPGVYSVSGSDQGKKWFINQFSGINGTKYAGWKDDDAGSKLRFIPVEQDPLKIADKTFLIVNNDQYAMTSQLKTISGKQGLTDVKTVKSVDKYYVAEGDVRWTFKVGTIGGTYTISTSVNGSIQYLNFGTGNNNTDVDISLSDTSQDFYVENNGGKIVIHSINNARLYYDKGFRARVKDAEIDGTKERFTLGEQETGMIVYDLSPTSTHAPGDPHEHITFTAPSNMPIEKWESGYKLKDSAGFDYKSYSAYSVWAYTVTGWVDQNGNSYELGQEITEAPADMLVLSPKWEGSGPEPRAITIEYYNSYLSTTSPIISEVRHPGEDIEGTSYKVLTLASDTYYEQKTGHYHHFLKSWTTGAKSQINALDQIELSNFSYFVSPDFETIRLTANWELKSDPCGLNGQSFVMINDRYGDSGVTLQNRYLALTDQEVTGTDNKAKGFGKTHVSYDSDDKTCYPLENTLPAKWTFTAQSDGSYQIQNVNSGKYLSITPNDTVSLSENPQNLMVLYNDAARRYFIKYPASNHVLGYRNEIYSVNGGSYDKSSKPNKNNVFLLGEWRGTIRYTYPAYSGGGDSLPSGLTPTLPEDTTDVWNSGYTVKAPSVNTYQISDDHYIWTYEFVNWKVKDSDPVEYKSVNEAISEEPNPPITLEAQWEYKGQTAKPVTVTYEVRRASTANTLDENLPQGKTLPAVKQLAMTSKGSGTTLYYTGEDVVNGDSIESYVPRELEKDTYITANGKLYKFFGWKINNREEIVKPDDAPINLRNYYVNNSVTLTAYWRADFEDPWGIDGNQYLIIYDKNNNDHFGPSTTASSSGLKRYESTKTSNTFPIYSPKNTDTHVLWQFDAQNDGSYKISTMVGDERKYWKMTPSLNNNQGGKLELTSTLGDATGLKLYQFDDKYAIAYMTEDKASFKSYIDYLDNNDAIFSVWGKQTPSQNNKFTLGIPSTGAVAYTYPKYSGSYGEDPEDTGTSNNLPASSYVVCKDNAYTIAAPAQMTYTSRSMTMEWHYEFQNWTDSTGKTYSAGISISKPVTTLELHANWEFKGCNAIQKTVYYNMNFNGVPVKAPDPSKPGVVNYRETVSGDDISTYEISDLYPSFYKTADNHVYEFMGWQAENGTVYKPTFADLHDVAFDSNNDGYVEMKGVWSNTYSDGPNREVQFFVSTKAISKDAFNDYVQISTSSNDFTKAIYYSLMKPGDIVAPKRIDYDWQKQVYSVVHYDTDGKGLTIGKADSYIRSMAEGGYMHKDGTNYEMVDFPSDEEMLEALKYSGTTLKLDEIDVNPEDINADNFTIRWYECKLMGDGYHIDGKLTPNLSYLKIQKQFSGEEALAKIPEDFTVNVFTASKHGDSIIIPEGDSHTNLELTLNDQREHLDKYGLYEGEPMNGKYGYIGMDSENNSYSWLLPVVRGVQYDIVERNYSIINSETKDKFGIAAQYSVINPSDDEHNIPRSPWFNTVSQEGETYPRTSIDIKNTSNIRSINLYNTYIEAGTFVIQKNDTGLDGMSDEPMRNVEFKVKDITDEDTGNYQMFYRKSEKAGYYTVHYGLGEPTDSLFTNTKGELYLTLPKPGDKDPYGNPYHPGEDTFTFQFSEVVPDGYVADNPPAFTITIKKEGVNGVKFAYVEDEQDLANMKITPMIAADPGSSSEEGVVVGASIANTPKPVSFTASKKWSGTKTESNVTYQLTGTANGIVKVTDEVVLSAANKRTVDKGNGETEEIWEYAWDKHFPVKIGNVLVDYTIKETKIGPYSSTSAYFTNNWQQVTTTTYRNANDETQASFNTDTASVRVDIENIDRSYICKIVDNGAEITFRKLREAVEYARDHLNSRATIQMLVDYNMLESDNLTGTYAIRSGDEITLTTAHSGNYQYPNSGNATITSINGNGSSFIIDNLGFLGLDAITLDGGKNVLARNNVTANGGIIHVSAGGYLKTKTDTVLQNSKTSGFGGAVYLAPDESRVATFEMAGGTVIGNSVTSNSGGAGIYVSEGAIMAISGAVGFESNTVEEPLIDALNGGQAYSNARQDIYLAGYHNKERATSLRINGNITSKDPSKSIAGSIWVWPEEASSGAKTHYKTRNQFAIFHNIVPETEKGRLAGVFRNAQTDSLSEATDRYLMGELLDKSNIYWSSEWAEVKLKKTDEGGTPRPDAKFRIWRVLDEKRWEMRLSGQEYDQTLNLYVSNAEGYFYTGPMPYGTYYAEEVEPPSGVQIPSGYYFEFVVDDTGAHSSEGEGSKEINGKSSGMLPIGDEEAFSPHS